jgi:hypothetical protein
VAAVFDIVVFGQWRNHRSASGDLADAVEDDFGAAVVDLDGSVNFDGAALQAANVANIFQAGRKDHDCEGAGNLIFTEVKEMNSLRTYFYFEDFPGNALGLADVLSRLVNGNAIGRVESYREEE